jgi:hypothetical protein
VGVVGAVRRSMWDEKRGTRGRWGACRCRVEWHAQVQGRVVLAIGRRAIGWTDLLVGWSSCIYIIQTRDRILANKRVTSAH